MHPLIRGRLVSAGEVTLARRPGRLRWAFGTVPARVSEPSNPLNARGLIVGPLTIEPRVSRKLLQEKPLPWAGTTALVSRRGGTLDRRPPREGAGTFH
jgi:hypothetical protein